MCLNAPYCKQMSNLWHLTAISSNIWWFIITILLRAAKPTAPSWKGMFSGSAQLQHGFYLLLVCHQQLSDRCLFLNLLISRKWFIMDTLFSCTALIHTKFIQPQILNPGSSMVEPVCVATELRLRSKWRFAQGHHSPHVSNVANSRSPTISFHRLLVSKAKPLLL